jgi:hypothetical protein
LFINTARKLQIRASPWRAGEDLNNVEFLRIVDSYFQGSGGRW